MNHVVLPPPEKRPRVVRRVTFALVFGTAAYLSAWAAWRVML